MWFPLLLVQIGVFVGGKVVVAQESDIIDLPHPEPQTHPRMPMRDRAAQFAPFAALTGHRAALAETERRAADAAEPENERFSEP